MTMKVVVKGVTAEVCAPFPMQVRLPRLALRTYMSLIALLLCIESQNVHPDARLRGDSNAVDVIAADHPSEIRNVGYCTVVKKRSAVEILRAPLVGFRNRSRCSNPMDQ